MFPPPLANRLLLLQVSGGRSDFPNLIPCPRELQVSALTPESGVGGLLTMALLWVTLSLKDIPDTAEHKVWTIDPRGNMA